MSRKLSIAVLLLSTLAHWPSEPADFTYDDKDFIEQNASIGSLGDAARAFWQPFPPEQPERGLYRPLTNFSYAIDHALFDSRAYGFHLVNVLLYAAVVLLAYALARRYFQRDGEEPAAGWLALAAALVFSVHPVHCDAVDSLAGRSELLALGFGIAALLVFMRAARSDGGFDRRLGFASAGLYALACLSKENAVVLPAVAILHLLARDGAPQGPRAFARRALDASLPLIGVTFLYIGLRLRVLGSFGPAFSVTAGLDLEGRLATMGSVYLEYARLLVFPRVLQLDFYYQLAIGLPQEIGLRSIAGLGIAALALAVFGVAATSALRGAPTGLGSPRGLALAGLGSALVYLAPVSHVFGIGALMAERFLFAPSLGLVLAALGGVAHLGARLGLPARTARPLGMAALVVVCVLGVVRSHERAREWRDGVELWRSAERLIPDDYRVHSNIAAQLIARDRLGEAEGSLRRALELHPGEPAARINLAVVLTRQARYDEARAIYRDLLERDPNDFVAWHNLGVLETLSDDDSAALVFFERALAINPNHAPALASLAATRERIALSRRFLHENRTRATTTRDAELLDRLARACRITGDSDCAERYAERARRARAAQERAGDERGS